MADWTKVSWSNTWGNVWYRTAMFLAITSSALGTFGYIVATHNGPFLLIPMFIIHSLYSHILGFELAHRKESNNEQT